MAIAVKLPTRVPYEYCGTLSDAIDEPRQPFALVLEFYPLSRGQTVPPLRKFTPRRKLVSRLGMTKHSPRDAFKTSLSTTRVPPQQHLHQMQHLLFKNSLGRLKTIVPDDTRDTFFGIGCLESLK